MPSPSADGVDDPAVRALFDPAHYATVSGFGGPDGLAHYLTVGWRLGLDPHPLFATRYYLSNSPDVAAADLCPLVHYVRFGAAERRRPHPLFDPEFYADDGGRALDHADNALLHYVHHGGHDGRRPNAWFDGAYYLAHSPDVAAAGVNPLAHYASGGWREGRRPHPDFDLEYYLASCPAVAASGEEPLAHFLHYGIRQGLSPSRQVDLAFLAASGADIARQAWLQHSPSAAEPAARRRLVVLGDRPEMFGAHAAECPFIEIVHPEAYEPSSADMVYAPDDPARALSPGHLLNVALCVARAAYDVVVVSHAVDAGSVILAPSAANAVVLSGAAYLRRLAGRPPAIGSRGRFVRLLPAPAGDLEQIPLHELRLGEIVRNDAELAVAGLGPVDWRPVASLVPSGSIVAPRHADLPGLLVLQGALAFDGAERHVAQVLRHLDDRYEATIVTTGAIDWKMGSVHSLTREVATRVVDLDELEPTNRHLRTLELLRNDIEPKVVWIADGSPWLVRHAGQLRALFRNTPIVVELVDDADQGWIELVGDHPDLRSFDRYVASGVRLGQALVAAGIEEGRVLDIPTSVPDRVIGHRPPSEDERRALRHELGVPPEGELYAFVAPLVPLQATLDFLTIVRDWRDEDGVHFLMVGDGELGGECAEFVRQHRLRNITRRSFVADLTGICRACDAVVMSPAFEGLPIMAVEALANGVPIVSTDAGDVRAMIDELGAGVVADAPDADGLGRALADFRLRRQVITSNARAGSATILRRHDARSVADLYAHAFSAVAVEAAQSCDGRPAARPRAAPPDSGCPT